MCESTSRATTSRVRPSPSLFLALSLSSPPVSLADTALCTLAVGCDPKANPTVDYINRNPKLYQDPLVVTYADAGREFPKNRLIQTCDA